jgi:hypothetical protein
LSSTAIPRIKVVCLNILLIRHNISVNWINASVQSPKFNSKIFRILQLVIGAGLTLGIIGVTNGGSWAADGTFTPSTISKTGIILYIIALAAIAIIFIVSLPNVSAVPRPERLLRIHIPIALLAISVRILYSVLCVFVHNSTFLLFGGSIVADVLMAIVEEFFVVIITLALGFKLDRISATVQGEMIDQEQQSRKHGRQFPGSKDGASAQVSNSGFETLSSA